MFKRDKSITGYYTNQVIQTDKYFITITDRNFTNEFGKNVPRWRIEIVLNEKYRSSDKWCDAIVAITYSDNVRHGMRVAAIMARGDSYRMEKLWEYINWDSKHASDNG